jgi:HSP20 family protein
MNIVILQTKPPKQSGYVSGTPYYFESGLVGWRLTPHQRVWRPPTDVYETDERFVVRVEIAGMKESDFTVRVDQNRLTISGNRPDNPEPCAYHRMEINFGEFLTEVELFVAIDINKVEADYKDGFLIVTLPKAQPRQISISGT